MNEKKIGWWNTEIIDVKPNSIVISGYPIQDLMGRVSYGDMLYLMIIGKLPQETAGKALLTLYWWRCVIKVLFLLQSQLQAWRPHAASLSTARLLLE